MGEQRVLFLHYLTDGITYEISLVLQELSRALAKAKGEEPLAGRGRFERELLPLGRLYSSRSDPLPPVYLLSETNGKRGGGRACR